MCTAHLTHLPLCSALFSLYSPHLKLTAGVVSPSPSTWFLHWILAGHCWYERPGRDRVNRRQKIRERSPRPGSYLMDGGPSESEEGDPEQAMRGTSPLPCAPRKQKTQRRGEQRQTRQYFWVKIKERRIHKCSWKGVDTEENEKNMSSLQMLKGEEFPTRRLILTKSPLGWGLERIHLPWQQGSCYTLSIHELQAEKWMMDESENMV